MIREPQYGAGERAVPIQSPTDVKYIRITDFDDEGIVPGNVFVTAENIEDRYLLADSDILFARSGATAGKSFIYLQKTGPSIFAGYCIRFRFDKKRVLPHFIYFYTKTGRYEAWVRSIQRPSGQPNINKEEFKSFTVPLPPLDVQREMVADMVEARASRKAKLAEADALLAGLDDFLLDQLGLTPPKPDGRLQYATRLPDMRRERIDAHYYHPQFRSLERLLLGVPHESLGDIITPSSEQRDPRDSDEQTFRYVEISGVDRRTGEVSVLAVASKEAPSRARMAVRQDDLIVSLTRPHHGSIALIDEGLDGCIASTGFSILRQSKDSSIKRPYLLAVLRSQLCLPQMLQRSSGGNYPAITEPELMRILIPTPDIETQDRIIAEHSLRRTEARRLREEAAREWEAAKARFEAQLLGVEVKT